jgi:hypothetical protein
VTPLTPKRMATILNADENLRNAFFMDGLSF